METAWNSLLSVYDIATASSDNIFVNESGGRLKGSPIDVGGGGARGARAPPTVGLEILSGL